MKLPCGSVFGQCIDRENINIRAVIVGQVGNMLLAAHSLGLGACWIHRAKEVFDTEEGKEILKSIGVEGDYEGIGNCILGYVDGEYPQAAPRKENRIFWIE